MPGVVRGRGDAVLALNAARRNWDCILQVTRRAPKGPEYRECHEHLSFGKLTLVGSVQNGWNRKRVNIQVKKLKQ